MNRLTTLGVAFVVTSLVFTGTIAAAGGPATQTHVSETVYAIDGTATRTAGGWRSPLNGSVNETRYAPGDRLQDCYDLTDEQTDEVWMLVADMRDDGATAEEIWTAVDEQPTEFGADTSTLARDGGGGPRQHAGGPGAPGGLGPCGN